MHEELQQTQRRIVGSKQLLRALTKNAIQTVYVAKDADDFLYRRVISAAEENKVPVIKVDTMKELGSMCRVDVKTTAAGILR